MNWWMMFLGLVLIVVSAFLGFMVGGTIMTKALVIPSTIMLQTVIPPKKADEIMQILLNDESHSEEGKRVARLFYTLYRLGAILNKCKYTKVYFIDALVHNSNTQLAYLRYMERKTGVRFEKEKTK